MSTLLTLAVTENPFARFGVNWYDFISQAIAFLIIAWILNKFVFKTVMKTVAERKRAEEEAAANNAKIQQKLQEVGEERDKIIHEAKEQADKVIKEAKLQMVDMVAREKEHCESLGSEILSQAREEAQLDQARLKTEMRDEIAEMIVKLTGKLTQMNLKDEDRQRLLQSAIDELTTSAEEQS